MQNEKLQYLVKLVGESSDQQAFDGLYTHFYPGLLSFANAILKDKLVAEEMIEDIFVNLWQNRKTLCTINHLSQYLYISVKHACLNYINSKDFDIHKKRTILTEVGDEHYHYSLKSPETLLIGKENFKEISDAINTLPPKCRMVFRLVKEEGLKYREVAQLLNISIKTVENHMSKALSLIMEKLLLLYPQYRSKIPGENS